MTVYFNRRPIHSNRFIYLKNVTHQYNKYYCKDEENPRDQNEAFGYSYVATKKMNQSIIFGTFVKSFVLMTSSKPLTSNKNPNPNDEKDQI